MFDGWQQNPLLTLRQTLDARRDIKLVIIDTLFRAVSVKSADDYAEVTRAMNLVLDLAAKYGCHILCLHHAGKRERVDPRDVILGSTAIGGAVDTIMLMLQRGEQRSIMTRQRYGYDLAQTNLVFNKDPGASELATAIESVDGSAERDTPYKRIREAILDFVTQNPGTTRQVILNAVQGHGTLKSDILQSLIDKLLRQEGSGRKGDPYRYWLREIPIEQETIPV